MITFILLFLCFFLSSSRNACCCLACICHTDQPFRVVSAFFFLRGEVTAHFAILVGTYALQCVTFSFLFLTPAGHEADETVYDIRSGIFLGDSLPTLIQTYIHIHTHTHKYTEKKKIKRVFWNVKETPPHCDSLTDLRQHHLRPGPTAC